ncbi:sulfur carrier protein ThiS [Arcticibacter sp. MXS-1]|uniref:sulfur carrier protein ThiS n=1 Tax=Arcticibacter sp. MXS-1 TaxID=3341726 RepID=UPI0035A8DC57
MQLVLPKGKVTATLFALFFLSLHGDIPTVKILTHHMEVTVNQQIYNVSGNCSIKTLLTDVLSGPTHGLAVAVNESIVTKADWDTYSLNPGDQVIVIKATQGG